MTATYPQSNRGLTSEVLISFASLTASVHATEQASVLLDILGGRKFDREFAALLGVDSPHDWREFQRLVCANRSEGGRLLFCEAAIQAGRRGIQANDWLRRLSEEFARNPQEPGEPLREYFDRLRPALEMAAEEVMGEYAL